MLRGSLLRIENFFCGEESDNMQNYIMLSEYKEGSNHKKFNIGCQDFADSKQFQIKGTTIWMGCLSDGHTNMPDGSPCPYPEVGAKKACEEFFKCAENYISKSGLQVLDGLDFKKSFIDAWKQSVTDDFLNVRTQSNNNTNRTTVSGTSAEYDNKEILRKYGCTFIFVVSDGKEIVVGQLGDGGIVLFNDDYDFIVFKYFTQKNSGGVDSLCGSNAEYKFFTGIYSTNDFANVFIASDGVFDAAACIPPKNTILNQKIKFAMYATELQEYYKQNGEELTKKKLNNFEFYAERNRRTNLPRSLTDISPFDDCSGVLFVTADSPQSFPLEKNGLDEVVNKNKNAIVLRNGKNYATAFEVQVGKTRNLLHPELPYYAARSKLISEGIKKIDNRTFYFTEIESLSSIDERVIDRYQPIEFYYHTKTLSAKNLLSFSVRLSNLINEMKILKFYIQRGFFETLGVRFDADGSCFFQIHPQTISRKKSDYNFDKEFNDLLKHLNVESGPVIYDSVKKHPSRFKLYYTTFYGIEKIIDNAPIYDRSCLPPFALIKSSTNSGGYAMLNLGRESWEYENADKVHSRVLHGRRCRVGRNCSIKHGTTTIKVWSE